MKPQNSWKFIAPPLVIVLLATFAVYHAKSKRPGAASVGQASGSTSGTSGTEASVAGGSADKVGADRVGTDPVGQVGSDHAGTDTVESKATGDHAANTAAPGAGQVGAPAPSAAKDSEPKIAEAPKTVAPPTCVTATFQVSDSNDSCKANRHVIKLGLSKEERAKFHLDSLCIRAGSRPVRFEAVKGTADEFMIPSISRKGDVAITARYCFADVPCNDGCKVPAAEKDEFLEAIGGTDNEKPVAGIGVWDPNDKEEKGVDVTAQLDGEVKKKLAEAAAADEERAPASLSCVYRRWTTAGTSPAACTGHNQAKNDEEGDSE